ncbi:hypothetical protein DAEQUDRAFT_737265 [Daedalea quercina L-15889]|uniref:Uncharacterized protein n=1 Tax=Daedalea quercina L-15889 TaxID=1314783 RepID=A0A165RCU2_9APHY|nr:hypothetical protein DAEQUDRAFT_737265 [Daedalea quercina L-15889]
MSPTVNSPAPTESRDGNDTQNAHNEYPEQRHAGAVGLGPEFGRGVTTGDKLEGYKEELKGKVLRKPEVAEHGHELRTGQLKRKQQGEDDVDPFQGTQEPGEKTQSDSQPDLPKSDSNQHAAMPPRVGDTAHPTEKGRYEQAASVAPEGTAANTPGEHAYRHIGGDST